jgi:hypothetical protein
MDNLETLITMDTQDAGRRQTRQEIELKKNTNPENFKDDNTNRIKLLYNKR